MIAAHSLSPQQLVATCAPLVAAPVESCRLERLAVGNTNELYSLCVDDGARYLVRVFGANAALAFDRDRENKVFVHIDGVRQQHSLDISGVPGSVDNGESFTIGTLYGWKTDGTLDEYRMYNRALSEDEVRQVYAHVPPAPAGC